MNPQGPNPLLSILMLVAACLLQVSVLVLFIRLHRIIVQWDLLTLLVPWSMGKGSESG
jgi:hypothetical protein